MRILRLLLLLIPLASCSAAAGCEAWRPVLIGPEDRISDETARAILAHNLTGRRLCGW